MSVLPLLRWQLYDICCTIQKCLHRYINTPYFELNCHNHIVMNHILFGIDFVANINGIAWRFLTDCHMRRPGRSLGNYDLIEEHGNINHMSSHSMPHQICIEFWVGHTIISQWINATCFATARFLIFWNNIWYASIFRALSQIVADCKFVNYSTGHTVDSCQTEDDAPNSTMFNMSHQF